MKAHSSHSKKRFSAKKHRSKKHLKKESESSNSSSHKKICEGSFTRTSRGFGFVSTGDGQSDIFIPEHQQKKAIEGDEVQVQLLRSDRNSERDKKRRHGRIIKILSRQTIRLLATLKRGKDLSIAIPLNSFVIQDPILIKSEDNTGDETSSIQSGSVVEVELLAHDPKDKGVSGIWGRIVEAVQSSSSCELGMRQVLLENQVIEEFPESVQKETQQFSSSVSCKGQSNRIDQTTLDYITIDGESARDFDDAVYVEKTGQEYRLFVAIADVAHYVTVGTDTNEEACRRGTSVYLPTHAVPMLPERLSNDLCSLIPKTNRYTLTCEMLINSYGDVTDYLIYESMIHSRARLIYEDVSDLLEGRPSSIKNPTLQKHLKQMDVLAKLLAKKRKKRGSINFKFEETTPVFSSESNGVPIAFERSYASNAMGLIEQFMLEANETVARHCVEHNLSVPYRVHLAPDANKIKQLRTTFEFFGIKLPKNLSKNPQQFNSVLEKLKPLHNYEELQVLLLRCMSLACYGTQNQGHFGLAASFYTHFTSPIRRYPDLLVHRALKEEYQLKLTQQKQAYHKKKHASKHKEKDTEDGLEASLMALLSQKERQAERAESNGMDLMKALFLEPHVGKIFDATITTVQSHGFRVRLDPYVFECFIPLETLEGRYFYEETRLLLSSPKNQHNIRTKDRLRLKLLRVDCLQRTLEFAIEEWINPAPYSPKASKSSKPFKSYKGSFKRRKRR